MSERDSTPPTTAGQFLAALLGALLPVLIAILLIVNHVLGLEGSIKLGPADPKANVVAPAPAPEPRPAVTTPSASEPRPAVATPSAPAASPVKAPPEAEQPAASPEKGRAVYNSTCVACHAAGVAGAPKTGDKAGWAPRLASGKAALYESALRGRGAMPPKGGNESLSDADVKAAVDYLTAQLQ